MATMTVKPPSDVILEKLRSVHPGATMTMRMDFATATLRVHCIVQHTSEVELARQSIGGLIDSLYNRYGALPYERIELTVDARDGSPENLDELTDDQKAERRKALIAASWKDGP